jgi:hypothetical protein
MEKHFKLVFVTWCDCVGDPEHIWKNMDQTCEFFERKDNVVCEAGFVFSEDDDFLNLTSRYMPSDEETLTSGARTKIPKKWILSRVELDQYVPKLDIQKDPEEDHDEDMPDLDAVAEE